MLTVRADCAQHHLDAIALFEQNDHTDALAFLALFPGDQTAQLLASMEAVVAANAHACLLADQGHHSASARLFSTAAELAFAFSPLEASRLFMMAADELSLESDLVAPDFAGILVALTCAIHANPLNLSAVKERGIVLALIAPGADTHSAVVEDDGLCSPGPVGIVCSTLGADICAADSVQIGGAGGKVLGECVGCVWVVLVWCFVCAFALFIWCVFF